MSPECKSSSLYLADFIIEKTSTEAKDNITEQGTSLEVSHSDKIY